MPRAARRNGSSMDNVDWVCLVVSAIQYAHMTRLTFSDFPLSPTKVPRLVYSFCDADNETERREYGAPRTSNLASVHRVHLASDHTWYTIGIPAGSVAPSIELLRASPLNTGVSIVGVALI